MTRASIAIAPAGPVPITATLFTGAIVSVNRDTIYLYYGGVNTAPRDKYNIWMIAMV